MARATLPWAQRLQSIVTSSYDSDAQTAVVTAEILWSTSSVLFEGITMLQYNSLFFFKDALEDMLSWNCVADKPVYKSITLDNKLTGEKLIGKLI